MMGLDMYLEREIYVGANFKHNGIEGNVTLSKNGRAGERVPIEVDISKISTINLQEMYWRKANAVHAWFVDRVQNGVDECQRSYVSREDLEALRAECYRALRGDEKAMMARKGFFFGSIDRDNYWRADLEETIEAMERLLGKNDIDSFYYHASW